MPYGTGGKTLTKKIESKIAKILSFWGWFFSEGLPSFFKDWWSLVHIMLGITIACCIKLPLQDISQKAFLPLGSIFIAIVFAWSGSISAILQSGEVDKIRESSGVNLFRSYVFSFQMTVLISFGLLIFWGLAALNPFENLSKVAPLRTLARVLLYSYTSLAIRECWLMVLRLQLHLLQIAIIRDSQKDDSSRKLNP